MEQETSLKQSSPQGMQISDDLNKKGAQNNA